MNGASGGVKNCSAEWAGSGAQIEKARRKRDAEDRDQVILLECIADGLDISYLEGDPIVRTSWI